VDKLDPSNDNDDNLITIITRNALESISNSAPQPRLWQESIGCSSSNKSQTEQCVFETSTLGNFSELSNPYLAQLPVGFHTGTIRQFAPRINSTVRWEKVSPEDMPANCGGMPDSFYARYANAIADDGRLVRPRNFSIEVCMPGSQGESPWKSTYSRQDFKEELFLNISVMGYTYGLYNFGDDILINDGIVRVTSTTTAGYFELPNYMNGGQAGPLIDGVPDDSDHCGVDCEQQVYTHESVIPREAPASSKFQSNGTLRLALVENKGVRSVAEGNILSRAC
jgi:hypothetical protein